MAVSIIHDLDRSHHGKILTKLSRLVDRGLVKPLIDERHPFTAEGVKAAHARLESERL